MPEIKNLTAQIIGIVACALIVLSYQCKKNKYLFLVQGLGAAGFAVNFIMLGSLASGFMNIAAVVRMSVLFGGEKFKKRWMYFFLQGLFVSLTGLSLYMSLAGGYDTKAELFKIVLTSFMVMSAMLVSTYVMWKDDGDVIRKAQFFFVSPMWLANNIIVASFGGIICESLNMISIIVSYVRYRKTGFEK
ncbi:MAG: YgjV family protein [Clostridia bacterium]|nr:YgjV family protein [Clostridia bacterium]